MIENITWLVVVLICLIGGLAAALVGTICELLRERVRHKSTQARHDNLYERWQYLATHPDVAPLTGWPARASRNDPLPSFWKVGIGKPTYLPEGWD